MTCEHCSPFKPPRVTVAEVAFRLIDGMGLRDIQQNLRIKPSRLAKIARSPRLANFVREMAELSIQFNRYIAVITSRKVISELADIAMTGKGASNARVKALVRMLNEARRAQKELGMEPVPMAVACGQDEGEPPISVDAVPTADAARPALGGQTQPSLTQMELTLEQIKVRMHECSEGILTAGDGSGDGDGAQLMVGDQPCQNVPFVPFVPAGAREDDRTQGLCGQGVATTKDPLPPVAEGVSLFADGRGGVPHLRSEISDLRLNNNNHDNNNCNNMHGRDAHATNDKHGQPRHETTEASRQAVAPVNEKVGGGKCGKTGGKKVRPPFPSECLDLLDQCDPGMNPAEMPACV